MSKFAPKISTPAVPQTNAIDQFVNQRDEIGRTESKKVQQPDGSWVIVTNRLPLTADEQAAEAKLKQIASDNLARYEDLATNFDVSKIDGLKEYVDSFTQQSKRLLGENFKTTREAGEKVLARSGLEDSTAAVQERARNNKSYTQGLQNIDEQGEQVKQQVRQNEQQNALSLYGLATGRQDALLNQLAQSGQFANNQGVAMSNMNLQNQWNQYNAQMQNAQAKYQAKQQGFNNLMSLASLGTMAYGGQAGWYGAKK